MSEPLHLTSKAVRDALEETEDEKLEAELYAQAESLEDMADRDRAPDESRLHGHHATLQRIHTQLNEDARVHLERAIDELPFHETV